MTRLLAFLLLLTTSSEANAKLMPKPRNWSWLRYRYTYLYVNPKKLEKLVTSSISATGITFSNSSNQTLGITVSATSGFYLGTAPANNYKVETVGRFDSNTKFAVCPLNYTPVDYWNRPWSGQSNYVCINIYYMYP